MVVPFVPVPDKDTGEPVTGTLAAMASVPGAEPVAVGWNVTLIVQLVAAARVAVQVPPAVALAYGPVKVRPMPVAPVPPVLLSVRVRAALVDPTPWLPNASEVGVTASAAGVATPVPVRVTGEPVTVTFAVMVAVPFDVTAAVGENT